MISFSRFCGQSTTQPKETETDLSYMRFDWVDRLYECWFDLNNSLISSLRNHSCTVIGALWGMVCLEIPTLIKVAYKSMIVYRGTPKSYGLNQMIQGKTPVLLLHGAAGTWNYMGDLALKLKAEGIPVFVINLGTGGASNESRQAVHSKIEEIQKIYRRTASEIPEVHIVAHSMGGSVAFVSAFSSDCSTIDENGSLQWVENTDPKAFKGIKSITTLALPTDANEVEKLEEISKAQYVYNITAKYDLLVGHKSSGLDTGQTVEIETTHVEIVYNKEAQDRLIDHLKSFNDYS